ncbi:MAG: YchE family NAAT transporter [Gammaproteobacteria bacterium]|jgi:multiple antibiotic resistance protein
MHNWSEYAKFFAGLVAIINPIGAIPMFINMTHNLAPAERVRTARVAAVTVAAVLIVSMLTGDAILRLFGITIPSFRVGGGILILLMAISMLHARVSPAKQTEEEAREGEAKDAVGVVPLGIPLLAGPGAISTVIIYAQHGAPVAHYAILGTGIVVVAALAWVFFRAAPMLADLLGRTGINVVTRIMGLIMTAIGVEFIATGLKALFPALG